MNNSAIGVFDSGMGGLSVWRELRRQLPGESLIYYGDGKNCPYGNRSAEEILTFVEEAVEALLARGAKMIVVACNTATAVAIDTLRSRYPIPFVGMEPAVKPAALTSQSGVIGVLATKASFGGALYLANEARYGSQVQIIRAVGEGFVELVERGEERSSEALQTVRAVVEPMIEAGADRIVLGCTHYPFLTDTIAEVVGDRAVEIIDPAPAVARRAAWLLDQNNLRAESGSVARYDFLSAAGEEYEAVLAARANSLK